MKPTIERSTDLIGEPVWLVAWEEVDGYHCEVCRSARQAAEVAYQVENEAGLVPAQGTLF